MSGFGNPEGHSEKGFEEMKIDDGDQAFPTDKDTWDSGFGGMSLRDHYAGQAMQALAEGRMVTGNDWPPEMKEQPYASRVKDLAHIAYDVADAMIKIKRQTEKADE